MLADRPGIGYIGVEGMTYETQDSLAFSVDDGGVLDLIGWRGGRFQAANRHFAA